MHTLRIYYDNTFLTLPEWDYEISISGDNDRTRTGNNRPWFFISVVAVYDDYERGGVALKLKDVVTQVKDSAITKVEWLYNDVLIDTLEADYITYQWVLQTTPRVQEVLNLSINLDNKNKKDPEVTDYEEEIK